MSLETRVAGESNALSLFDQLKNSVNHNIIISSTKLEMSSTTTIKKSSTTTAETDNSSKVAAKWRINVNDEETEEDDSSLSEKSIINACLEGGNAEDCNDSTTSSSSSSASSSSLLSLSSTALTLKISDPIATAAETSANPTVCSQQKTGACRIAEKEEAKCEEPKKMMKHLSETDKTARTTADKAIDYTLQAQNSHSSKANTVETKARTKLFLSTTQTTNATASNLLASLTGANALGEGGITSIATTLYSGATKTNKQCSSNNTNTATNISKEQSDAATTSITHNSNNMKTTGAAATPHFPTPLPPPSLPVSSIIASGVSKTRNNNSNSSNSSIGIVLGTKRNSSSFSTGSMTRHAKHAATSSQETHTFGLPHANVANICSSSAANSIAAITNNMDTKLRSHHHHHHHPLVSHKKTASSTANSYRFTDSSTSVECIKSISSNSSNNGKKKRCTDRYDSSESSDSGVATSLSCTDSSTASSEDASEPGSPFSPQANLVEDQQLLTNKKMAPQTILAAAASATNNATASNTASNKHKQQIQQQSAQKALPLNACNNTANNNMNTKLPSLQKIGAQQAASAITPQPIWPWNAPTQHQHTTPTAAPTAAASQSKKRNSTSANDGLIKKSRTSTGNAQNAFAPTHLNAAQAISNASQMVNASKRLKAAALEESQTKITGYFKSQMKAQQLLSKRQDFVPNSSGVSSGMTTTALTMSTPATTASLNKYFNILSQIKENNSQREQQQKVTTSSIPAVAGNLPNNITVAPTPSTALPVPALKKIERSKPTKIAQVAPNLRKPNTSTCSSNYSAAANLTGKSPKKHVAIAPRTPDMKPNQMSGNKEIAPKQQQPAVLLTAIRMPTAVGGTQQPQANATPLQQQQAAIASAQTASLKQQSVAAAATVKMPATATTATNAPTNAPTLYQLPVQLPNLVQLPQLLAAANGANIMQLSNAVNKSTAQAAAAATTAQAAQAAAAQYFLNGTVFKLQQFTTATTTTATSAVATASGTPANINPFNFMHANDLQELLLKQQQQLHHQQQLQLQQQQKNVATASAALNANNFQEIFQQQVAAAVAANQQQQQFQQLQRLNTAANNMQQPVFMATPAGLLLNAASLPAMLAQAAAAIAANNNQQQQQKAMAMQQQQLPALQPIQAAMPALSSIFGQQMVSAGSQQSLEQNVHEMQQQQQQQQLFQQQIALVHQQQQQQHQSFVTATQPPPLSVVSTNSTANSSLTPVSTPKLAIVKANSAQFPPLSSQPPPLVTISSGSASTKQRATGTAAPIAQTKPSALAKPYQKRAPKVCVTQSATKALNNTTTTSKAGKISAPANKIVSSPTTPPPLVPAFSCSSNNILAAPLISIAASTTATQAPPPSVSSITTSKPTPALVSIASVTNLSASPKLATSTSMSTTTCTTTSLDSSNSTHTEHKISSTTTAIAAAKDLFDIVKNSEYPNITATTTNTSTLCSLFTKIKEEPLDEPLEDSAAVTTAEKSVMPTFSTNLPAAIKLEFMEEETSKMSSSNPSALQDCSSSSFCSHSNSISSSADLSLEASTAASLTSSAPSPAPSTESTAAEPVSACDSNSNSCATTTAASLATSQDQLNDLSTMSSSASSTSSALSSVSSSSSATATNSCSLHLSLNASINAKSKSKETLGKRDLPTPESGLGCSLSNSESSNSLASSSSQSSSSTSSKASSPELEITNSMSNSMSNTSETTATTAMDSPSESISTESQSLTPPPSVCSMFTIPTTIDTQLAELSSMGLPKAAISPILSQPKTIRFPATSGFRYGHKGAKRHDGVCYWHKCNKKHDSSSKLLDHMQTHHVNSQTGPFACLWVGCKVYNKESCSRRWLERHVLSHGGSKQFKCIVEGCGLRFGSQLALQKHVNNHFTATENKESTNKRTSDPPVPKQLRKNGKKLRYRRQPFSARMFDFFDTGIMEGLNHRLRQISTLTDDPNNITFQGQCMMRRKNLKGVSECFVRWSPKEIISDEWLPECVDPYIKTVNIKQMRPAEKIKVESLLMTAYRLPYASNLFANDFVIGRTTANNDEEKSGTEDESAADSDEDDDDENETSSMPETETNASSTTVSSYPLTIARLEMQQRKKHPRKPQKRMPIIATTEQLKPQQQQNEQ